MTDVTSESISHGFDYLDTLAILHSQKTVYEVAEALSIVQESLGMDEGARKELTERAKSYTTDRDINPKNVGYLILGIIVGMATMDHAHNNV